MHYLIDTYNLVHTAAGMGGVFADMTVRKLCQFVAAMPAGEKVTLVMDGRAKPEEPGENEFPDVDLVYSGAGVSADLVIGQKVERSKSRKKLTVVTNDRAVALHARRHFAHAMGCETFLRRLAEGGRGRGAKGSELPAQKTRGTATSGEAEHWMKEFGLGDAPAREKEVEKRKKEEVEGLDIEDLLGPPGWGT